MLPCNLVFEGMGRVGKTTLIASLTDTLMQKGIATRNYTAPAPKTADEGCGQWALYLNNLAHNKNDVVIYDRGHLSEMVYAPVYRNYYSDYYHHYLMAVDRDIVTSCSVPTYIIYVYPYWQSLMKPGNRVTDDLIAVPKLYNDVFCYTAVDVIRISTHRQYTPAWVSQAELVENIIRKVL